MGTAPNTEKPPGSPSTATIAANTAIRAMSVVSNRERCVMVPGFLVVMNGVHLNGVHLNDVHYTETMAAMETGNPRQARHSRDDVVEAALRILDDYGLPDLTMRRLAASLDVQPSALYWHFPNKQALLAELADRIVANS